jgi:hypothetical protein
VFAGHRAAACRARFLMRYRETVCCGRHVADGNSVPECGLARLLRRAGRDRIKSEENSPLRMLS